MSAMSKIDIKKIVLDAVFDYIRDNPEEFYESEPEQKKRFRVPHPDLTQTIWYTLINDPNVWDPRTNAGKNFRRRFRVPFPLFNDVIVPACKSKNVFSNKQSWISVEFKVLLCLRILGRGVCADDITELTGIGESTVNQIFHRFCTCFVSELYEKYVSFPSGQDLQRVMADYSRLGLDGAVGSMDCTHLHWDKCPESKKHLCTGKEGFPSLAFLTVADHNRCFRYVSRYFHGALNDIQIIHQDSICKHLRQGMLVNNKFKLYDEEGIERVCSGAYLITDGGMCKVINNPCLRSTSCLILHCLIFQEAVFINPLHLSVNRQEIMWSEWLESVRKDVECSYGLVKARFRFLKNPINYHSSLLIENAFKVCCMLHNMIRTYDGIDVFAWEADVDWEELHPPEIGDEAMVISIGLY
jgi:hypothetical protein